MRMLRTGVTRAFGANLRHAIGKSVSNRFSAMLVGMGVTAILQSSTATAMMVASFASRGLVATAPALAVMLGADIGTTMVAQVLSFDISWLAPLTLALGVILHFSSHTSLVKQIGRIAIGLGLMLLALKLIVTTAAPLRESQLIIDIFGSVAGETLIGIIIAALLTWLAHSSLAVVLLVMSLASTGAIPVELTLVLVIGANIGGTLPPIMATAGEGPEARRVTIGNALFKVCGAIVLLPLLDLIMPIIAELDADPARQVVNFHTLFNLAVAIGFIFLTGLMSSLMKSLLPSVKKSDDPGAPKHLDNNAVDVPTLALSGAARETLRMADIVDTMLSESLIVIANDDTARASSVSDMDDAVDKLHEAVKLYVTDVTRQELDRDESLRANEIMSFATNLEHIGDIAENLMDIAKKKGKKRLQFSEIGQQELTSIHTKVGANLKLAISIFMSGDVGLARQLLAEKRTVIALEREAADAHMQRLRDGRRESIETSALHMDILRDLKRIHSHVVAVAYPVLERAGELDALSQSDNSVEKADSSKSEN
jgi:phosphate:Na+ symporter